MPVKHQDTNPEISGHKTRVMNFLYLVSAGWRIVFLCFVPKASLWEWQRKTFHKRLKYLSMNYCLNRYFKQFTFLILLSFVPTLAYTLPTFIKGKVIHGKGLVIRVSIYSDLISFQEKLLDIYEIGTDEDFNLSFEITDIQEVFVRIGYQSFSFFAEAGKNYQLQIDNIENTPKSALIQQKPLHLLWSNKNALNEAIDNFNFNLSTFLEENFVSIYKFRNAKLLHSFEQEMLDKLSKTSNLTQTEKVFFENHIIYQFANLKNASHIFSDLKLGETYLQNNEVLYRHPSYMLFFNQYFSQYFLLGKRNTNYRDFIELIQSGATAAKLLSYLEKDPILKQERIRELLLLSALKEVYYNNDFNLLRVETLIKEIVATSQFIEHKNIGTSILNQLTSQQIGATAPKFQLKSTEGIFKSLDDYKGQYVYLVFLADNCQACQSDLTLIDSLNDKYNAEIAFVGIMVNYTKEGLDKFSGTTKSNWDRLLFNNDFALLNTYRVRNFPFYMLLDRKGKILLNPAKKPHESIDRYFDFLLKRDKDKARKSDILFR